jgi:anti-sigma B factor antagonist
MQLEQKIDGDIAMVIVHGDITSQGGDVVIKDKINSLLNQKFKKLLLDLGDVKYVDSSGLGHLAAAQATVRRQGGELKLLNVTRRLSDLLVVTRLITIFDTFDSEQKARESFGGPAANV